MPSYLPSELYLADSCGGECTRGAVVGSRQAAPRTNRTRIDLGRRGREDFFATWRPQWCIPMPWGGRGPCNAVGGAAVVRVANSWMQTSDAMDGTCYLFGCVRESEGRRKLRIAARSPALTMRCGCRTGVGRWECAESCPLRGLDDAACLLVSAEGWIAMTKIIWHYLEAPAATRRRVNRRRQKAWCG